MRIYMSTVARTYIGLFSHTYVSSTVLFTTNMRMYMSTAARLASAETRIRPWLVAPLTHVFTTIYVIYSIYYMYEYWSLYPDVHTYMYTY